MKRAIVITWGFAAVVALLNISTLWPLIVTPLAVVSFTPWREFLIGPLGVAVLAALLAWKARPDVIIANIAFWFAFFAGAEAWRTRLMTQSLPPQTVCVETNPFFQSLTIAGHAYQFMPHAAAVTEDDRVMLWSYAERRFWEAPRAAYENLDLTTCRTAVQALLEKPQ